jgi:hypothetical protein
VSVGLLRRLALLPLAPVEGLLWLAGVLQRIAEEELDDPARWRAVLDEAEAAHARGELSDAGLEAVEEEVVAHLLGAAAGAAGADVLGGVTVDG